jgi:hypothetical protein
VLLVVAMVATFAIAIPVLGADPSPTPSAEPTPDQSVTPSAPVSPDQSSTPSAVESSAAPSTSAEPAQSATPSAPGPSTTANPGKAEDDVTLPTGGQDEQDTKDENGKKDKGPEIDVTVTGTVAQATDGKGRPSFTLTAGTTIWELSAGPPWFWGDKNPLAAYVGKSVTVVGEAEQGGTEVDVDTVDGKAIRAPGKPPWAGGPWVVGPTHPGWKPWMADGKPGS